MLSDEKVGCLMKKVGCLMNLVGFLMNKVGCLMNQVDFLMNNVDVLSYKYLFWCLTIIFWWTINPSLAETVQHRCVGRRVKQFLRIVNILPDIIICNSAQIPLYIYVLLKKISKTLNLSRVPRIHSLFIVICVS